MERLTSPRSTEAILAPVDLVATIDGVEYALAVLEDFPGQRLAEGRMIMSRHLSANSRGRARARRHPGA